MSSAFLTDRYELTMLAASLRDGTAARPSVFELFSRRLSGGRRFGVVAGTGRLLTLEDVRRLSRGLEKLKPFIVTADWRPGALTDRADLRDRVAPPPEQLSLF